MSKNFEQEYKALANEDLPDLWNRIENGLTPRTTALTDEADQDVKQEKRKAAPFWYRYRTVAAAAACAIVIIPAVIFLGRTGREKSLEFANDTAEGPAMDMAMEEIAMDAAMGETAVESGQEAAPETASEDMDTAVEETAEMKFREAETDDCDSKAQAGGAAEVEAALEEPKESGQVSDMVKESAKTEMAEDEAVKLYEQVTLNVTQVTEEIVKTDQDFFYGAKMEVVKDPSGELTEGTEIMVWISMHSSRAYVEGEEYTLDLSYEADRECPYRVV